MSLVFKFLELNKCKNCGRAKISHDLVNGRFNVCISDKDFFKDGQGKPLKTCFVPVVVYFKDEVDVERERLAKELDRILGMLATFECDKLDETDLDFVKIMRSVRLLVEEIKKGGLNGV